MHCRRETQPQGEPRPDLRFTNIAQPHSTGGPELAGIQEPEVIDLIAEDKDGNGLLVIVQQDTWTEPETQAEQLQAKINTYAQFALDGGLVAAHPHLADRPITIRLDCSQDPPAIIRDVLTIASQRLSKYDVSVTVMVRPKL
ncbi:DUF6572 domain-containing protein [Kribbella sp. NPDC055071]